jgi:hypothetical protein
VSKRKFASKPTALCWIVLVVAAEVSVSSQRIQGSDAQASASSHSSTPLGRSTAVQGPGRLAQTIRVFIHPEDIYPGAVLVKPGPIDLVVENQTQADVSMVVERVSPGQVNQSIASLKTVDHRSRNQQGLTLTPGMYVFYEESRPYQQGKIIVDPRDR